MKHYLITGASRGVGRETAIALASMGHALALTARDREALLETARQCATDCVVVDADLSHPDGLNRIKSQIESRIPALNGIVHNAGLLINKPFSDLTDQDWQDQISVNLMAPARLTRDLLSVLSDPSHIVMISSMGGYQGSAKFPGLSAYSATKGGASVLAECLAAELSTLGVHVNALCLGAVQTDMLEQAFPGFEAPVTATEMGRYIAEFLANGDRFYNGRVLPVALADPD
ncbi:MAG: SDR family NAD(P)-dependent oxidoreductase [Bacteroidota bacterium]